MAHEIGDVVVIDIDGKDTPAIVLGVDEHGALTLRVFGSTSEQDYELRSVDETGQPYDYEGTSSEPAPAHAAPEGAPQPPAQPATPGTV